MRVLVDADDLHLARLSDGENFRWMVDAAPRDVGDVQQAVDAAEVDERTVVGDVLDHAFHGVSFFQALNQFRTLFGTGLFQNDTAGHDDVAAALVHFQDLERLRRVHQRGHVADRTDIDLRTRQEGNSAIQIDGEAALDLIEDLAVDFLVCFERDFQANPAFLAACLFARQDSFAKSVFDTLEVNFNFVADTHFAVASLGAEFLQRHAAFNL